jgi:hypothetical protein
MLGLTLAQSVISMAPRVKALEESVAEIEVTMADIQSAIQAAVAVSKYHSAAPAGTSGEISTPVHPSLR